MAHFAAREWDAMPQILADNIFTDDRRRVVGSGVRIGRDAHIADMRAIADLRTAGVTPTVMAIRGSALSSRVFASRAAIKGPRRFVTEVLGIVEINADKRMVAFVSFELDESTMPSPSSMRGTSPAKPPARAHMDGHHEGPRRAQPTRSPPDDGGLGEHRPPSGT